MTTLIPNVFDAIYRVDVPTTSDPAEWLKKNRARHTGDLRVCRQFAIHRPEEFRKAASQRIAHPDRYYPKPLLFPSRSIASLLAEVRTFSDKPPLGEEWLPMRFDTEAGVGKYAGGGDPDGRYFCRAPEIALAWRERTGSDFRYGEFQADRLHVVERSDGACILLANYSAIIGSVWFAADDNALEARE